jgi:hypothetical protein
MTSRPNTPADGLAVAFSVLTLWLWPGPDFRPSASPGHAEHPLQQRRRDGSASGAVRPRRVCLAVLVLVLVRRTRPALDDLLDRIAADERHSRQPIAA